MRALCVAVVLCATACPNPCVFLGGGCNDNDDCSAGQLCRIAREFEAGCAVVQGRCIEADDDDKGPNAKPCGSVDDCDEGECCNPATNNCVGEVGYTSLDCDEFTCRDCNDTAFGDRCTLNEDCDDDEGCSANGVNGFGTISENGVCRPSCDSDDDCAATEGCNSNVCTVFVGTPCTFLDDGSGDDVSFGDPQCLGLNCVRLDADGERIDEAYCTDTCFEAVDCPVGFTCDDDTVECRKI